jgi:hypothetical protein
VLEGGPGAEGWQKVANRPDLLPEGIGATIETAFQLAGKEILGPLGGFAATAVVRYLFGRQEAARGILRSQLERAGASAEDFRDAEQLAAAAWRYIRAARDQTADENLRILAQAMIGLARRSEVWASDFLKYAEILAPLSRDELILIGQLMADDMDFYLSPRPPNSGPNLWKLVEEHLVARFGSEEEVAAAAARAQRSGLLVPITGFDGTHYELSPGARDLRQIVDIEAALNEVTAVRT